VELLNAYLVNDHSIATVTRDEAGRRVLRQVPAEWVAFFDVKEVDEDLRRQLRTSVYVSGLRDEPGGWVRVSFVNRIAREDFCMGRRSFVSQLGLRTHEADVSPVVRWMVDHDVKVAKPRRVYLDLETDSRVPFSKKEEMRILCFAIEDEDEVVQCGMLEANTDRAEKQLLDRLWKALQPYDQVLAWNGDGFDFPVIFARSADRGCDVDARMWLWLDHLELYARMNKNASESAEEKRSMRLNDIAVAELKMGKEESPDFVVERLGPKNLGALSWDLWELDGDYRDVLERYNYRDTDLLRRIEKKTGYVGVFDALCEACGVFGDTNGLNPTHQLDGFLFRLGKERGIHFATKSYYEGSEKFRGAYVMEPKCSGITRDVHVCDFKSLYPSIILTWNMSPETKRPRGAGAADTLAFSPLTNVYFSTVDEGILPEALREMIRLRGEWSKRKSDCAPGTPEWHDANRKSTAYKVAANSFYGVVGSPFSRFFDRQVAESCTQCGVWLIRKTIELIEEQGWTAIYGDTDSVFVKGCTEEEFRNFTTWCNENLYPELLVTVGCKENHIKLAYEKAFDRLVMTSAKRYIASYIHADGKRATKDSKPEIKGLEFKRGDTTVLATNLQAECIDLLVGGLKVNPKGPTEELSHYHDVLARVRDHCLSDPLPLEEIRLSKQLTKPIREYVKKLKKDGTDAAQPAHVQVAKILEKRGEAVGEGTRIEYIVADGAAKPAKVIPAVDYTGQEVDRFHLWEHLVFPATQRLLKAAFLDHDWDAWGKVRPKKERAPRKKKTALLGEDSKSAFRTEETACDDEARHEQSR
jgi:DNA polymerase elongation subunit (family B)